jgi:oligopeptide transport system substrate-binding protein
MKEAGYTPQNFPNVTLTYSSQGSSDLRNELSAVQQMWQSALGITVKLDDIDFNKLLEERHNSLNTANGMQMYALYWVSDYPDPQDWLTLIFDKGSSKNAMNYGQNHSSRSAQQQQVQKLMEEADVTTDQTKRVQLYNQAEQELVNDVVWIPRYQYKSTFVRKPCVVGIVDNAQQTYSPDLWGNVYISSATSCAKTQQYS